jgi:hypothetical protein
MSWRDMQRLADVLFIDQLKTFAADGGEELVRECVAELSKDGRRLLRDALDALPVEQGLGRPTTRLRGTLPLARASRGGTWCPRG